MREVASAAFGRRRGLCGIKLKRPPPPCRAAHNCCIPLQVKADMASDSNLPEWRCNKELPPDFDMWVPCVAVCVCGHLAFSVTAT